MFVYRNVSHTYRCDRASLYRVGRIGRITLYRLCSVSVYRTRIALVARDRASLYRVTCIGRIVVVSSVLRVCVS